MAKNSKPDLDSPAGYNGGNGPGSALSLPTKKFNSSDLANKAGKGTTIEGPCSGKENYTK